MGKRETKKFSGERVGFGVIRSGETGDKEGKVGGWWYFTPKSSTTKTKVIGRVE